MLQVFRVLQEQYGRGRGRCAVSERGEQLVGEAGDLNRYGIGRGLRQEETKDRKGEKYTCKKNTELDISNDWVSLIPLFQIP